MSAMAFQITSLTIVYSTVYSGADKKNIKAPRHWSLWGEVTGEFTTQRASNTANIFIWWRHHDYACRCPGTFRCYVISSHRTNHYADMSLSKFLGSSLTFINDNVMDQMTPIEQISNFITVTSQCETWRLKSPASGLFAQSIVQSHVKENVKAPRHSPLWWESTGDRWIPLTKGK